MGGTGRSDLPGGDPSKLYDSLFNKLLKLPPERLVFPAHHQVPNPFHFRCEIADNPRLQKKERGDFIELMDALNLKVPTHYFTEAPRTNRSGGNTFDQWITATAAKTVFMSIAQLQLSLTDLTQQLVILDVREQLAFDQGHIPNAINIPRGQLELRVDDMPPDTAHPGVLRLRQDFHPRRRDPARYRFWAGHCPGWWISKLTGNGMGWKIRLLIDQNNGSAGSGCRTALYCYVMRCRFAVETTAHTPPTLGHGGLLTVTLLLAFPVLFASLSSATVPLRSATAPT